MYSCIIVGAGSGTRANLGYNKVRYLIKRKPLLMYSVDPFINRNYEVILVINKEDEDYFKPYFNKNIKVAYGGNNRTESVRNGLALVTNKYVLIHDAARVRITEELIEQVEKGLAQYQACFLSKRVTDTIYQKNGQMTLIDRNSLYQAETPQAFITSEIKMAYDKAKQHFTDDVSLYQSIFEHQVGPVIHEGNNQKITYQSDLITFEKEVDESMYKIGNSYDIHQLVEHRKLILGGIEIPFEKGLLGHSDADCLLHAVAESIIGALGLGDLGTIFPDTDMKNKDLDSKIIVKRATALLKEHGYKIVNIDTSVFAEKPKLAPYIGLMRQSIADLLDIDLLDVNVKAATNEKLDAIGEQRAIAASATVLIMKE
ncbi:MAG: 2-C-methyl-D-erythritol 2,4-cyclodiphosphate synthase [Tenericutes bacterium HGW-Tenericutes-8]|nr:MAG: 2-C-methyl-D-erythritol 2,4-cyclodiphosphate synthase [Tenericutes bacterium HGW-Tenericutes-8]